MTRELTSLFDTLDKQWNTAELNLKGEVNGCEDTQTQILREFSKMDADNVRLLLHTLTDDQLTQIVPIVDNIIAAFPSAEQTLMIISTTRNIFWLRAKLNTLAMTRK